MIALAREDGHPHKGDRAERMGTDSNDYILYDSIYETFCKRQTVET